MKKLTKLDKLTTSKGEVALIKNEWPSPLFGDNIQYLVSGKIKGKEFYNLTFLKTELSEAESMFEKKKHELEVFTILN